jgi:hypothetical protein
MKRISVKGVLIGNIADIISAYAVFVPLAIYIEVSSTSEFVLESDLISEILKGSTVFLVASNMVGVISSVLGGYVAARIAKHDEMLNGSLSSILSIGTAVYTLMTGSAADQLWQTVAWLPLSPALATLGGLLRARQTARRIDAP